MSKLLDHARRELDLLYPQNLKIKNQILDLLQKIKEMKLTNLESRVVFDILTKLLRFDPLTALTGNTDEWKPADENGVQQNIRCIHVFKDREKAYDIDGHIQLKKDNGKLVSSVTDSTIVEFPYEPTTRFTVVDD